MGQKMNNAPVYFTVAQVRFNPVLKLESYLSTIQDKMRVLRFSDYKRVNLQQIPASPAPDEGDAASSALQSQTRYLFGNIAETTSFVLENNALALQTTDYDVFESFSDLFMKGLGIIHEALQLEFSARIGLRYFDAVIPEEGETLEDYLIPEVSGLSHKLDGQLSHAFSETVATNPAGKLVSRVIIQEGQVGLPPAMQALAPKINTRFTQAQGWHAILDTDAFNEQREAFDLHKIELTMSGLHTEIRKSFDITVTPHAMNAWQQKREKE